MRNNEVFGYAVHTRVFNAERLRKGIALQESSFMLESTVTKLGAS
jgi:hypothetical protein